MQCFVCSSVNFDINPVENGSWRLVVFDNPMVLASYNRLQWCWSSPGLGESSLQEGILSDLCEDTMCHDTCYINKI